MSFPGIVFAGPAFVSARSACDATGTTSVDESLAGVMSPPPDTVAVFVRLAEADCATDAVTEMAGHGDPAARTSPREHETRGAATVQSQPGPLAAVGVSPAGSESATVT